MIKFGVALLIGLSASAHDIGKEHLDPPVRTEKFPEWLVAAATPKPKQAEAFEKFAPRVKLRWDEKFLYVESNGLPAHNMMIGITAWQQQVPLPQPYSGQNAWRIPLKPRPSKGPRSIRNNFLRGAIAAL
jgi:hypothetical protein